MTIDRSKSVAAIVLLLALAASGCAPRTFRERADPPAAEPRMVYQTNIAMGPCLFRPEPAEPAEPELVPLLAPLATALLSSAVTTGVNYIGKAIQESAAAINDRVTAIRNVEVNNETFGPCLQLARGWFLDTSSTAEARQSVLKEAKATWAKTAQSGAIDEGVLDFLWERRMWIAAEPDFILEAEIVQPSADAQEHRMLTIAPVYALLDAPISQPLLRPSRARNVAVFFAFTDDAREPSLSDSAGGGIVLGRLRPGQALTFVRPEPTNINQPNRGPLESKWFKISAGEQIKPMTIAALIIEHRDPEPFLQFVADVFTGAQAPVGTALQTAIVPSLREAAEENEQATRERMRTTYEGALATAFDAAGACAAGVTNPVAKASDLRSKIRALNLAARAIGRNDPVAREDVVPLSTDASAVQKGCVALHDTLQRVLDAS